jgi:transposase-like protein
MKKEINNEEIKRLFENGKNCGEIAKIFTCDPETIRLRLKKEGVVTGKIKCNIKCVHCSGECRKEGKTKYEKQRYLCLKCNKLFTADIKEQVENRRIKYEDIKKMYLVDNMSTVEIGRALGTSSTVPQRILNGLGITRDIGLAQEIKNAKKNGFTYDEYVSLLPIFKKYRKLVTKVTNKQLLETLSNYEKRGKCGIKGAYQLDHKYSILEGFKNGVEPEIIGNIKNLEFIPWEENINKSSNCSITLEELYRML